MEKVTKSDLVDNIYQKQDPNVSNYQRKTIQAVVDLVINEMFDQLSQGNKIELRGFGTLEPFLRNGRKEARVPKTGEVISVPPHYIAHFKPGKELKDNMAKLPVSAESVEDKKENK